MTQLNRRLIIRRTFVSKRNLAIVILFSVGCALFITIYDGVLEHDGLASLDGPLRAWAADNQSSRLTAGMQIITNLSSPLSVSIMTITGAIIWALRKKDFWRPALIFGAVALALASSAVIKTLTARERPTITDLIDAHVAISYSFPSGHTIGAATLLLALAYFYYANAPSFKRLFNLGIIVLTDIALVAFSRVYLGYHWLTDVTASIGLAFIILAIVITIDTYVKPRKRTISSEAA